MAPTAEAASTTAWSGSRPSRIDPAWSKAGSPSCETIAVRPERRQCCRHAFDRRLRLQAQRNGKGKQGHQSPNGESPLRVLLVGTYHHHWEFLAWSATMLAALIFSLTVAQADATSAQTAACSAGITQIEGQIAHSKSNPLEGPTAAQTLGAQLHRQPTSAEVKSAEHKAKEDFQAALARAREADSRGDAAACARALNRAKELYGLQ